MKYGLAPLLALALTACNLAAPEGPPDETSETAPEPSSPSAPSVPDGETAEPGRTLRVATYNIQFLTAGDRAARIADVQEVIEAVDADIYALQEIENRAALERVFDPGLWQLVIDDQSRDEQDLAVAVRAPLRVRGGLDADDEDFLFPGADNDFFPNRRDVLHVPVEVPGFAETVHILVVHQRSRRGGRASTDFRRAGAARRLLEALQRDFDDRLFVLLGDFNDNPDDRSLNILESGDPNAEIEIEDQRGAFLVNLTESLAAEGLVTNSLLNLRRSGPAGAFVNVDRGSRRRNFDLRDRDAHTGDILFDQILIPQQLLPHLVPDSTTIFNGPENEGASDHLPVYAEFQIGTLPTEPPSPQPPQQPQQPQPPSNPGASVRIVALLPNPAGPDPGNESVTLENLGATPVQLEGWHLEDRSGARLDLEGRLGPRQRREIVIPADREGESALPLGNSGDVVLLLNAEGAVIDRVEYSGDEVRPGQSIEPRSRR